MCIYIMGSSQKYSFMDRWLESSIPKSHHRKKNNQQHNVWRRVKKQRSQEGALSEHSHLVYENWIRVS